jgi:hypothetical protein
MAFQNLDAGSLDVFSAVTGSSLEIPKGFWKPGTGAIYNGYFGKTSILGFGQASISIGMNPDSPLAMYGAPGNVNLHNTSLTTYIGDHRVVGRSSVKGIEFRTAVSSAEIYGAVSLLAGKEVDIVGKNTVISGANVTIGAPNLTINGLSWSGYVVGKLAIAGKGFDIPHPTKSDTHRLRYICLEGPEVGTYLRGKLINNNVIELPDYWTESFIDPDSITVNLTPVGNYQELFIKEIKDGKILVRNNSASKIHCHYTVFAERKTKDKLQVEYEGQTPADYPGDNSEYSLAGWDYDRR